VLFAKGCLKGIVNRSGCREVAPALGGGEGLRAGIARDTADQQALKPTKDNSLFLIIGPPSENRTGYLRRSCREKKFVALIAVLRINQKAFP
jgi:hypothetical protein